MLELKNCQQTFILGVDLFLEVCRTQWTRKRFENDELYKPLYSNHKLFLRYFLIDHVYYRLYQKEHCALIFDCSYRYLFSFLIQLTLAVP